MSDTPSADPDERLGAYADRLADASSPNVSTAGVTDDDLRRAAAVAAAFGAAIDVGAGEVDAVLEEAGDVAPLPLPELPEDYILEEEIGRGGMGVVYRAQQRSLDRTVAVKVLRPGELLFGNAIKRFTMEARALAKLRHRHIVTVHEVGHVRGQVYYTMDLIEGSDLSEILRDGRLTPAHAVRLMRQVASAIAYTHAHGLVHRDLKPANILVDADGEACVTDFGLAMELGGGDQLTLTGQILGTPAYMSPEQARGDSVAVGEATDVYALGALLYECLTGHVPLERSSPIEQIHAVIHDDPPRPRKHRADLPPDLEVICLKALEKRTENRYATARAFLEDLERWESGLPIRAEAASASRRAGRWVHKHRAAILSAASASLVAILVFAFVVLPFLGRDASTLVTAADRLLAEGRHDAAESLYTAAIEQSRGGRIDDAVMANLIEARREVARKTADEGHAEDGRALLLATRKLGLQGRDPRTWVDGALLSWDAAIVMGEWPDDGGATLGAYGGVTSAIQRARLGTPGLHGSPFDAASELIVSRLETSGLGPAHPRRYLIRSELAALLDQSANAWPAVHGWIVAEPSESVERLLVAVEATFAPGGHIASHHVSGIRATSAEVLTPETEKLLAGRCGRREGRSLEARVAGHLLGLVADIPVGRKLHPTRNADLARDAFDPRDVAAAWKELQGLDAVAGYRRRIELCIAEIPHAASWPLGGTDVELQAAARSDVQDLRNWFAEHVGLTGSDAYHRFPGGAEAWWRANGDTDPRDLLTRALGLPERPTPEDRSALVERMAVRTADAAWLHHLLALTLPSGDVPRVVGRFSSSRVAERWRAGASDSGIEYRLRTVRVEYEDGAWRLAPEASELQDLGPGDRVEFDTSVTVEDAASVHFAFTLPGTVSQRAAAGQVTHASSIAFGWNAQHLGLELPAVGASVPDESSHRGLLLVPDHHVGTSSTPDHGRNSLTLAVIESRGASAATWTLADWRAAVAADLGRLADLSESMTPDYEFHNRYQRPLWRLCLIAVYLRVPEATDALQRLSARAPAWNSALSTQMVLLARVHAGDVDVLSDTRLTLALNAGFDAMVRETIGPGGKYWARVLVQAEDQEIRDAATAQLASGPLSSEIAGDLLDAEEAGAVELPEAVRTLAVSIAPQTSGWMKTVASRPAPFVLAIFLLLLSVAALIVTLVSRGASRVLWSAALVAVGLFVLTATVSVGAFDLLPDVLGAGLAVIGVAILRPHAKGGAATLALLSLVGVALFAVAPLPGAPSWAAICALVAVSALVAMARDLIPDAEPIDPTAPRRPARAARASVFLVGVGVTLFGAVMATALFEGTWLGVALLISFVALPAGIALQGLRAPPSGRARLRAIPLPFVLCYIAPLAAGYGSALAGRVFGVDLSFELDETAASVVLVSLAICVAWSVYRLFGAARARAAYLR